MEDADLIKEIERQMRHNNNVKKLKNTPEGSPENPMFVPSVVSAMDEGVQKNKKRKHPCGNKECAVTPRTCEIVGHGWGELDKYGLWSVPCYICSRFYESKFDDEWPYSGPHITHCCVLHGCKYHEKSCPVVSKLHKQAGPCEYCEENKIPNPDDPNYDLNLMTTEQLIKEIVKLREELISSKSPIRV